jgi:hypothetical protein
MPLVDYQCTNCQGHKSEDGRVVVSTREVWVRGKLPRVGHKITCGINGCTNKAIRIVSADVAVHIRGKVEYDWQHNESFRHNVNGQDIRFTFVDHKEGDPAMHARVANEAAKQGIRSTNPVKGISNVHKDRNGRNVVSVMSNVPDPLGKINRAKQSGSNYEQTTTAVNTPTRRRGKK